MFAVTAGYRLPADCEQLLALIQWEGGCRGLELKQPLTAAPVCISRAQVRTAVLTVSGFTAAGQRRPEGGGQAVQRRSGAQVRLRTHGAPEGQVWGVHRWALCEAPCPHRTQESSSVQHCHHVRCEQSQFGSSCINQHRRCLQSSRPARCCEKACCWPTTSPSLRSVQTGLSLSETLRRRVHGSDHRRCRSGPLVSGAAVHRDVGLCVCVIKPQARCKCVWVCASHSRTIDVLGHTHYSWEPSYIFVRPACSAVVAWTLQGHDPQLGAKCKPGIKLQPVARTHKPRH